MKKNLKATASAIRKKTLHIQVICKKDSLGKRTIHDWFELTHAQYLTIPRSVLQSMPLDWQVGFVKLLEELDKQMDWKPNEGQYWVQLRDSNGRYLRLRDYDPFMDYERGRRIIPNIKGKVIKDFVG